MANVSVNLTRVQQIEQWRTEHPAEISEIKSRRWEFLQKPENKKTTLLCVGVGVGSGIVTGALIGGAVGATCGTPGGPPGMLVGGGIGAGVGAVVGGIVGASVATVILYPRYKEFLKTDAGKEFAGKFTTFLSEETILQDYCCPITLEPVMDGVRAPNGTLYERQAIEKWIKTHGNNPTTREKLKKSELVPDIEASFESAKKYVEILEAERDSIAEKSPHLIAGFEAKIMDIREWYINYANNKFVALQKQFSDKKITYQQFQKEREAIQKYYNV